MQAEPLTECHPIPLVPAVEVEDRSAEAAAAWAADHAAELEALADRAGVLLIRGFRIDGPAAFRAVCAAIRPDLRTYAGGDSPRSGVADRVYTSTEYPQELEVLLHNELSYAGWSPDRLFFGCLLPAATGGETQIADGRAVYRALPAGLRERFETRGIAYLQHLWDAEGPPGIGKSWQETFETGERAEAERYLAGAGMDWDWTDFGLRTRARRPAVRRHAVAGESCWHNQADQWHRALASVKVSIGAREDPRFDPATAGEASLGNHVTYGDGGEIDPADLETVRAVSRACEVTFPWQAGDVMLLDNVLAMHGRKPFTGPRRVLVAMA
ncbi:Taurine dioxygenase, alpha-ketoglutarate-dependent [Tistlia consotensis]|uniref:Taurine dioxygenase, alpha-ketoglutarate-dependent n=1 Tax=Tistlia consotensis USBA 355 TaxID=560819 RepID=A0A1Y6C8S5_9PROT|nr:TauD/TfdA family dioxygenase [Tistlia consotensis]SMF41815.1 Taurine dioxygenase, alpha-ketoglutarate-dependent [Tistlia consotensis USBA 355]SNR73366.1 Taurine dioxygenase, alpha-ketoglutarate-dependent [Tistlia consotensis]